MINQKRIVPGALAALAVGTVARKVSRERRNKARSHGFRRLTGRGRC